MNYGGIYLDNDVYVIKSMNDLRKYEMVLSYENIEESKIGNQIMLAHKNARFLKAYYDSYRLSYRPKDWYYNGGKSFLNEILYIQ
jgi:mannosyltransferase OCH1-like enzyme